MAITGSFRVVTLAIASLLAGAMLASAQSSSCPASPSYSPDFSANQSCVALNPSGSSFPAFGPAQSSSATVLQLTSPAGNLATSAWYQTPQNVTSAFSTTFAFQIGATTSGTKADGVAFVIQNSGLTALGPGGCGIGFGDSSSGCAPSTGGIPNSVAVEFNTYGNGVPVDPNSNDVAIQSCPTGAANSVDYQSTCNVGYNDLTGTTINLSDGNVHTVTITYTPNPAYTCGLAGSQTCSTLDVVVDGTDLFNGGVLFDMTTITSGSAYIGFTAGTGGDNSEQDILNWIFAPTVTDTATVAPAQSTPTTFTVNGGFSAGSPTTGYDYTAQQTDTSQTVNMVVTAIPISQQACNTLVQKNPAFVTAQCFVYQNGGGQNQDTSVLFEVTCTNTGSCGQLGNPFDANLGTDFSFNCSENVPLLCGLPPLPFTFGFPNLTSSNGLPSVGFLKGEGPNSFHPCTPYTDSVTPLFNSNQIQSFSLGDTSGGAKGGSGGTTSCWVMTYQTQYETPTVTVTQPASGATYTQGQTVLANYACSAVSTPAGSAVGPYLTVSSCTATDTPGGAVLSGSAFDTSTLGTHTFTASVQDSATNTNSATVTYTVVAAPAISGPSGATFTLGAAGSAAFSATGYPTPSFSESGALPAGVTFVDNKNGSATLSGTPTVSGTYPIVITAQNGVGSSATLAFTLTVAATVPAAGKCNGIYDGIFKGNLTVSSGQTCTFVGGGVTGNLVENGGKITLTNAAIGGNLQVNNGSFSVGPGTTIKGNFLVVEIGKSTVQNLVCGASIGASLEVVESGAPVEIGSTTSACPGNIISGSVLISENTAATIIDSNTIGGALADLANSKPTQVYSNTIKSTLSCTANSSITGGGNTASAKQGQCSKF